MIQYPTLKNSAKIGVTAPSSGVPESLHTILREAIEKVEAKGYDVSCGETVWTQKKAKSASAKVRADEFNRLMQDEEIDLIVPPWGGELLIEILEHIEFENIKPKWILGYSDVSALLFSITLKTGIATAHGTNLIDLRGDYQDATTAMWESVLKTKKGEMVVQHSSEAYQKEWDHENPSPCVFHLTEQTEWKSTEDDVSIEGRLLGGCLDILTHLVGTPYGDVASFRETHSDEPILWYFENCDLNTTSVRRSLVQMKLAGWFDHCSGILFGRSAANQPVNGYVIEDVYEQLAEEIGVPVVYDIDCGHVPPQLTLINGARAKMTARNGKGKVVQTFD
ncbi:S66 family peptidase [Alkalihalobacillus sp. CinArs1]|uniref:S66 family peptidase n=1 Tax=Alkalihalobacillus sp. CinArs1 TaxID=2995314 RepID=UPI0022DD11D1|nr:S66 peptidase family protein [Alkalihalobacillus sp. CinArs1]